MYFEDKILVVGKPSALQAFMDDCEKVGNKLPFLLTPEQYIPDLPSLRIERVVELAKKLKKGEGVEDVAYFKEVGATNAEEALGVLYDLFPNLPRLLESLARAPEGVFNTRHLEMAVHGMEVHAKWTETNAECAAYLLVTCLIDSENWDGEEYLPERWLKKLQAISNAYPKLAFQVEEGEKPRLGRPPRLIWMHAGAVETSASNELTPLSPGALAQKFKIAL